MGMFSSVNEFAEKSENSMQHIEHVECTVTVYSDITVQTRSKGYKTFFMLSSAETNIYTTQKC